MQVSVSSLINRSIISIATGRRMGTVAQVIVDPGHMKMLFLKVATQKSSQKLYLPANEVREMSHNHVVINSEESLAEADELVRYQKELSDPVLLLGYRVITTSGKRLGSCEDYVIEAETHRLIKLYVQANLWQRLLVNHFIIDIADLVRIENRRIIVRDATVSELKSAENALPAETV